MILRTEKECQAPAWQIQLKNAITDTQELFNLLELEPEFLSQELLAAIKQFPLRVPRAFVQRMQKANVQDPLLRQILPLTEEMLAAPGYSENPLLEAKVNPIPGLLHKYQGRILLTLTGGCAINCRYCFRRHFPYSQNIIDDSTWQKILTYIAKDTSIEEVIFSGGDPLLLRDGHLQKLTLDLAQISHVKILRIHTRLPIVIPERITSELLSTLTSTRLLAVMVLHCNHGNEIDCSVIKAMQSLRAANITLLNQAVLLKDVNDNEDSLINLSKKLFEAGILPYYLHVLDKVTGTAHFEVNEDHAKELVWNITQRLPGYLVPKLVKEIFGVGAKTPLMMRHQFRDDDNN